MITNEEEKRIEDILDSNLPTLRKKYKLIGLSKEKVEAFSQSNDWKSFFIEFVKEIPLNDLAKAIQINEEKNHTLQIEKYYSFAPERLSLFKKENPRIYDFMAFIPIQKLKELEAKEEQLFDMKDSSSQLDKSLVINDFREIKDKGILYIYRFAEVLKELKRLKRSSYSKKKINKLIQLIYMDKPDKFAIYFFNRRRYKNRYENIKRVFNISRSSLGVLKESKKQESKRKYKIIVYSTIINLREL